MQGLGVAKEKQLSRHAGV